VSPTCWRAIAAAVLARGAYATPLAFFAFSCGVTMQPQDSAKGSDDPGWQSGLFGVGAAGTQSFLHQLLDNTPTVISVTSLEDRFLFVNYAWEQLTGAPLGRVVGRHMMDVFRPATARLFIEANRRVVASGAPLQLEETIEWPEGVRYYHSVKIPIRDAEGRIIAIGGSSIDVTERKWAEQAARAAAARSLELLDASPDGIAVVRDLRLAYVNPAFCNLLGYAGPEELLGRSGNDVLTEPYKIRTVEFARARAQGLEAPARYEVEYLHRDGHAVPAEIHVRRIDFDGVPSSLAYIRDITERRKSEQALRESEARLRRFFEATFESIVLHEHGKILDVNQAAADLFGYSVAEMIGRSVLEFSAPSSRGVVREHVAAGDEQPYEAVGLRKDGSTFQGELRGKNLSYPGRTIRVAAMRDLTERKRAEQTLQDYAGRLQDLSRSLLAVQEEERQRLSRELHDEVGQLLTGLRLTLERGGRLGPEGLREAVGEARGLIQELTAQVRDLSLRLRPTMLDDLGLLPALLWHFERYTAQTGVHILFHHEGLDRRFSPEGETAAYRIVQETLTNVARHAGVEEATVWVSHDGNTLRLQIEDHGKGFDLAGAPTGGAGCGLSGMRQRAALRGGRLELFSAVGAGTRVTAEWPENACGGA
jgi:PAS domain S-box-containing protein